MWNLFYIQHKFKLWVFCTRGVSSLHHKAAYNSMEEMSVVVAGAREAAEVLRGARHLAEQPHVYVAQRRVQHCLLVDTLHAYQYIFKLC